MEKFPLRLEDLIPVEVEFTLGAHLNKPLKLTLGRWSVKVKRWVIATYGAGGIEKILTQQDIIGVCEIAFFMLKQKELFPGGVDEFMDAVATPLDQATVVKSLVQTLGIGEPQIEELIAHAKKQNENAKEGQAPLVPSPRKKKTGAKSLTR